MKRKEWNNLTKITREEIRRKVTIRSAPASRCPLDEKDTTIAPSGPTYKLAMTGYEIR